MIFRRVEGSEPCDSAASLLRTDNYTESACPTHGNIASPETDLGSRVRRRPFHATLEVESKDQSEG